MTLPASGAISMNQVNVELGAAGTTQRSLNDSAVRTLFGKASGQISMSDGWGKSYFTTPTTLGSYNATWGGYYTGTQCGYYLFATTTTVGCQWKTSNTTDTNVASTTDGYTNTMCNANASHPAFQYADNLSAGGFTDWYIGARCELQQQYNNRSCGTIPSYGTSCYWSSTESIPSNAWALYFFSGNWFYVQLAYKTFTFCVRPLRRKLI